MTSAGYADKTLSPPHYRQTAPPPGPVCMGHREFIEQLPLALRRKLAQAVTSVNRELELHPPLRALFDSGYPEFRNYAFVCETEKRGDGNCDFTDHKHNYHLELKYFKANDTGAEKRAADQVSKYLVEQRSNAVFLLVFDCNEERGRYFFDKERFLALETLTKLGRTMMERLAVIIVKPPHLQ